MSHLAAVNRRLALALGAFALVLLSSLFLLGTGNAGVRLAARDTTLTGMATWPQGSSTPWVSYAITGTFSGRLGYGMYFGTLTVTTGQQVPCTLTNYCSPVSGEITFSTNAGTFRTRVDPAGVTDATGTPLADTRQFLLDLVVAGGTGKYTNATGHLSLSYQTTDATYFDGSRLVWVHTIEDSGMLTGKVTT